MTLAQTLLDLLDGSAPAPKERAAFFRGVLQAHTQPSWVDVHVRVSVHTRPGGGETWVRLAEAVGHAQRDGVLHGHGLANGGLNHADSVSGPYEVETDLWAWVVPVGGTGHHASMPRVGVIVVFEHGARPPTAAPAGLGQLADSVLLAAHLRRLMADRAALATLSAKLPQAAIDPHARMFEIAALLKERMRADGAKIYLLRRHPDGLHMNLLACAADRPSPPPSLYAFSHEKGWADWVIEHNDWLLIRQAAPADQRGEVKERAETGLHGLIERLARKDRDAGPAYNDDEERTVLIVPLRIAGQAVGALSVWRKSDEPFDAHLDREPLERLGHVTATAGLSWVQAGTAPTEIAALDDVSRAASEASTLGGVFDAVAHAVARVAQAAGCVFLVRDGDPASLLSMGNWIGDRTLPGLAVKVDLESRHDWRVAVQERVAEALASAPPALASCAECEVWPWIHKAHSEVVDPEPADPGFAGAFVVIHRADASPPCSVKHPYATTTCDALVYAVVLASLLRKLTREVLWRHVDAFSARVGEEFDRRLGSDPPTENLDHTEHLLNQTALLLSERLGADDVSLHRDDEQGPNQRPSQPESLSPEAPAPRPETDGVRSRLSLPIVEDGARIGVFAVLTRGTGGYLGAAHQRVGQALVERAARAVARTERHEMLQRLNKLASGWAGKRPHDLPLGMLADLTGWMGRFVERGALVAIFANTQGDDPTLYVCSQRLEAVAPLLARHVTQANAAPFSMPLAVADSAVSAWSEPLTMAGAAHLRGRLWAVTVAPLRGAQRDAVHEAAREVALALERERSERVWLRDSGIFRHALIGPIAGIVSAARSLARLAQASADKSHRDRVDAKRLQVEEEAAAVRLWGDNQQLYKLYLGEKLDLTPHPVALGAILEACRLRFQDALAARRQSLSVVGDPRLAALSVDRDALELALANLLDNARKYALAGTPVVLHVVHDRKRGVARVTVEDQGNGIPESRRESIYQIARRHHKDPIRTIDGSGLGLPLARTIARAHGGDLSHTSDSLGWTTTNGLAVHRVRFILTLPAAY